MYKPLKSHAENKAERLQKSKDFEDAKRTHDWNSIVGIHTAQNGGIGMARVITHCKLCGQDYIMLKVYPVICPNQNK